MVHTDRARFTGRLNMASYWTYLAGGCVMLASFFVPSGAANSGWTSYPASADHGNGLARIGELPAEEDREGEANQQEDETCQRVLQADDFVIEREDVFSEQNRLDSIESRHGRKVPGRSVSSYDTCRRGDGADRARADPLHAQLSGATNSLR